MVHIYVIALIGLPGAGKTTFCKILSKHPSEFDIIHICYDEIFQFDPKCSENTFKIERKTVLEKIEHTINDVKSKASGNRTESRDNVVILIDDNNYYASMRYEIYKLCKAYQLSFGQIYFPIELQIAQVRNSSRNHNGLPSNVINKMNDRLEVPSDKNYWENNTVIVLNSREVEQFWGFLKTLKPVERTEKLDNHTTEISFIHKVDICLRRRISELLQNSEGNISVMAMILNKKRKCILSELKSGSIEGHLDVHSICERLTL